MVSTICRENSILASFLYANDVGTDTSEAFVLDQSAFTSSFRRATANKINDETNGDKMYGFLSVTLQDHTAGTSYEQDWIDIIAQTPMPLSVVKRMHEGLLQEHSDKRGDLI